MDQRLKEALTRLARVKGYTNPAIILAASERRHKRSKPILYWTKEGEPHE